MDAATSQRRSSAAARHHPVTLYWLTNTGVSSARLYWENNISLYNDADVSLPSAVSVFPGENYQAPRSRRA